MHQHIDNFIVDRQAAGLSPRTIDWYRLHLGVMADWITDNGAGPCDPAQMRRFLAHRIETVSPAAGSAHYRAATAFYNWLVAEGVIDRSPMERIQRPKVPRKAPRRVEFDDYRRLIESIGRESWIDLRDRLMVKLLFLSGVRVAELCVLDTGDLDIHRKLLTVAGKGNRDRLLPIWPAIVPSALEYLLQRPVSPSPALFYSDDGSGGVRGRITPSGVRQRLRRLWANAGMQYQSPHAFRHGLAIWLLNAGQADMSMIQKMLGHSQISTTQAHYADWLTDGLQRAYTAAVERATVAVDD